MDADHGSDSFGEAQAICRQRGGRLTRQRQAVLAALQATGQPMSAYDLFEMVRGRDDAMTPASTYRSLDFLVQMGLVHRLESTKSYLACLHPDHPHAGQFLICRRCGTVVETEDPSIVDATTGLGERHGFTVDHGTVELTGTCGACRPGQGETA